jgi:hypothetical protein
MQTGSRLRQVPGGWLLARDLRDQPRLPDLRMAQHHIAAHRTWGCSTGLAVMLREGQLTVTPGAAVDRCGRVAILGRAYTTRITAGQETAVVLRVRGRGPAGQVLLRERAQPQDLDIPLARIGGTGTVTAGDGERQWLRCPGPARRLGGTLARGYPVTGTVSQWTAHVDLDREKLPSLPAVVASPAGRTPGGARTTVEVANVLESGFDIVVRSLVRAGEAAPGDVIRTAPHAVAWLALVPAGRPGLPPLEEQ